MYNYRQKYSQDKQGEKFSENAWVWNVHLDEAENFNADIIQGYWNITDGLLVFVSCHKLFFTDLSQIQSRVTTFVAQTSQALELDNTQIMVSLLVETN